MRPGSTRVTSAVAAVERAARELADRWQAGERPRAEEYLDRFPHLWDRPDAALELVAEELTLRDEHHAPATADELAGRFPQWAAQVRALVDCHAALGPQLAPAGWPRPGDRLGPFHLHDELGRGAHGRVYRADQPDLAGRAVVLKVGPDGGREHLSLARLQHSHIVPLYSVHEFPDRRLLALCMPYFGGVTLADLPARLAAPPPTGDDLLAAVPPGDDSCAARGPAWATLGPGPAADAVCWIGACLADALQYAHDRGLLHLDVKPSNVLLAADGTPMLLDFHLARPPLRAFGPTPPWLGGTPGFMAPEHEAAVEAVRDGRPLPAVDARADVFSLGALLAAVFRDIGRRPSPGVSAILAKCTAPAAADRYPSADAVAADLRRHLSDLPLKGVRTPSWAERWAKWRRRRPVALPAALTGAALVLVGGGLVDYRARLAGRVDAARRDGEARATARARAADDLRAVCEEARRFAETPDAPADEVKAVARRCRTLWGRRGEVAARLDGPPSSDRDARWRADLRELAVLVADLEFRSAAPSEADAARARALATLDEAERMFGPTERLGQERTRYIRLPTGR